MVGAATLTLALVGAASAAPPPSPATANHNGIVKLAPPGHGLAPIGRTSAGAVPVKSTADLADYHKFIASGAKPHTIQRPIGAELYSAEPAGHPELRIVCTATLNAESSAFFPYVVSAGHCMKDSSATTGKFYYPTNTFTVMGHTGSRFAYDETGDYGAIRMDWDHDPAQWLGSDGATRNVHATGNPVVNETAQAILGNSHKTVTGVVIEDNICTTFTDGPTVHCGLGILQWNITAGGCAAGGDSGSPVNASFDVIGVTDAAAASGGHCFIWFTRMGDVMLRLGLFAG